MDDPRNPSRHEYVSVLKWRLAALQEEVNRLRVDRDELARQIADREAMVQQLQGLLRGEGVEVDESDKSTASPADKIRNAGFDAVFQAGHPLHYREICTMLKDKGVEIGGKDPAATLLTLISRDSRLERVGRGIYGVAGQNPRQQPTRRVSNRKRKGGTKSV